MLRSMRKRHPTRQRQRGFTLVEMSFVLVIVGLIITALLPALSTIQRAQQASSTRSNMEIVTRAIAAFVQSNGCLPCPTPQGSLGAAGQGFVAGAPAGALCPASCPAPEGIIPYRALGLGEQFARDGWGRFMTFRVNPQYTANFGGNPPSGTTGFCALTDAGGTPVQLHENGTGPTNMALLLLSHGANGGGAYTSAAVQRAVNAAACSLPGNTGYENCNADRNAAYGNRAAVLSDTDPFDDILLPFGRDAIVTYLGNPGCS